MITSQTAYLLKSFLTKFSPGKTKKLLSFFTEQEKNFIENQVTSSFSLDTEKYFQDGLIASVHYSWLISFFTTKNSTDAAFFLSTLPSPKKEKLAQYLQLTPSPFFPTPIGKNFIHSLLLEYLAQDHGLLPIEFLPSSPLNFLLSLSKETMVTLIDYLGLYDLANEVRHIVDLRLLKKISAYLTKEQRDFIKTIPKQSFSFPRLNLHKWDGSKVTLLSLLHSRGLQRLGAALIGQNHNFIWYLTHKLDIGRGNALIKYSQKEINPTITKIIIANIEEIVNLLTKEDGDETL